MGKKNKSKIETKAHGKKLAEEGKYKEAIECYESIIERNPKNYPVIGPLLNEIGIFYFSLQDYTNSIKYFKKVLELIKHKDIYNNLGNCYVNMRLYDKAINQFQKSLDIEESYSGYLALANIYFYVKEYDKSVDLYKKALKINKTLECEYNLSFVYLAEKKMKEGLELYEKRLSIPDKPGDLHQRLPVTELKNWNGKDSCKNLLVVAEQGLGDNIMYYRFVLELSEKYPDIKITYFCKQEIAHLFKTRENINIISFCFNFSSYDYKLYIMSIPKILEFYNITPNKINYINVNEEKNEYWKKKLSFNKKFKIGIVYRGLLNSFIEKYIPIKLFKYLEDLDVELICLHKKSDCENDLKDAGLTKKITHYDIDNEKPFEDTVCILNNIDLLLSVDTYSIHLAGVMGVKSYLLLGKQTSWLWFTGTKNEFYSSVENIIMDSNNDWESVIKKAKDKITKEHLKETGKIVKISINRGDLLDKYSILKIKAERRKYKAEIIDKNLLQLEEYITDDDYKTDILDKFLNINKQIWELKEKIDEKVEKNEIDDEFNKLTYMLYLENKRRSEIKYEYNKIE